MAGVLERKMSASLFKETASQRFRRESLEMWEQIKIEEKVDPSPSPDTQVEAPVKKAVATVCGGGGGDEKGGRRRSVVLLAGKQADKTETSKKEEIFPRKVKSKFIKTKPASWEKEEEEGEKKEGKEKVKEGKEKAKKIQENKPVRRIADKSGTGPNIRKI